MDRSPRGSPVFPLATDRLWVRPWTPSDAEDALATYGAVDVTGWLTPAADHIRDTAAMLAVLSAWAEAQANLAPPRGRWAIERRADGVVVGGLAVRLLPPYRQDLEISFQLRPDAWGQYYAAEAAAALIAWAFTLDDVEEFFAVVLPANTRAIAVADRLGMYWVGETDKYYGHALQVYRIRPGDLAVDELPHTDPDA
ncbi:MAG: GNAT family N-acetyltransferase [Pseudonocardia sp.]|nr:GNAT family N-acetyltransferase [Pseudonocardia sp.]